MASTKVSDSSRRLHRLVETLRERDELPSWSETVDRALRVELAYLIDSGEVSFTREDYDVAYTIPPEGWVLGREFDAVSLVGEGDVDSDDRWISFSTPIVVKEMADEAKGQVDMTLTELVESGVKRMLG